MLAVARVMQFSVGRVSTCHCAHDCAAKFKRYWMLARKFHSLCSSPGFNTVVRYLQSKMPSQIENFENSKPALKVVKLTQHALLPTKGSKLAAGYDLYSAYDYTVEPMSNILVKTDLQICVPHGCYGRVAPRSGLALKNFIDVGAGVVDEDYRGNLGVVLFNFGKESFQVKRGDRIAQFICEKIEYTVLEEVQSLDQTDRGIGGFGSTGTK